jgi:hypothetical protein
MRGENQGGTMPKTRRDFTLMLGNQILFMAKLLESLGMGPQIDWTMRSLYDQQQLYLKGLSKCDGISKFSAHQKGLAADILIIGRNPAGKLAMMDPRQDCPEVWEQIRWHWVEMGGEPMIEWDQCHFETK